MSRLRPLLPALMGLLLHPAAANAAPATPDKNATATARLLQPAAVRKLQDLNFAYLGVTTGGTAVVDPNTDGLTTTGGVIRVGGLAYAAMFEGIAPEKNVVIIRLPKTPITVTRIGGTETMTVSNWTLDGSSRRTVPSKEPFTFKVGGTLTVNANQVEGTYVGTFTVDVQYP